MVFETPETAQRAPAKGRILETANTLFYQDGILNVGVDRIIAQSSVTKATFYKHYRSKDNLILEYVKSRRAAIEKPKCSRSSTTPLRLTTPFSAFWSQLLAS